MTEAMMLLGAGLLGCALIAMCDRGVRPTGVSWFDIVHEMRPATKKSKGRMQQTKKGRR